MAWLKGSGHSVETTVHALDYCAWLRIEHWINVLFLTLLIRSGIEVLATHPKLYRRYDSIPGTEWARFTRKTMPRDKLYDTLDEEEQARYICLLTMQDTSRDEPSAALLQWR